MGEVYRAHDTRLNRYVALKVLSTERLTDPVARVRFEREMAIVARLSHPRICTLLDVGHEGDRLYFAMELLHGETLATRLDRAGAQGLRLQEALDVAVAMCEALAYAHRHGVVHRDVKPANVMLTPDGVKLLDFGVARMSEPASQESQEGRVGPTSGTSTLSIVGTPAYMAPEQIDGQSDHRTDLFSLGAVLYEMLAGQRAFPGQTSSDIIGAVIRCAPSPLSDARPGLSPALVRLVHRCLRREVGERWQSAADLGEALRLVQATGASTVAKQPTRARWSPAVWLSTALAAGVLAIAAVGPRKDAAPVPREYYVDDIPAPDGERIVPGHTSWSRDGRHVAIVTQSLSTGVVDFKIWTREIGIDAEWRLAAGEGPEHVTYPSWSPDGQSLAYFRDHKLIQEASASSAPVTLADAPEGRGTAWLDDRTVLYAPDPQGDIWQVSAQGGAPSVLIRRQDGDLGVKFPVVLPGGTVLFWAQRETQPTSEVRAASANDPSLVRTIVRSAWASAYADEHLFFVKENVLVAQRLDPLTWTLLGRVGRVPVETGPGANLGAPYLTAGGSNVGIDSIHRQGSALAWVTRTGALLGTVGEPAPYRSMALSPSGARLLVERAAPGVDKASIWLIDLESGATRPVATEVGAQLPVWHPTEDRVAFRASVGPGGSGAVVEHALIGRTERRLVEVLASARPAAWVDDSHLLWWAGDVTGRLNGIFVRGPQQKDSAYRTVRVGADIRNVVLRPGGRGVAYTSNESGIFEVYTDVFPTPGRAPWRVSSGGGNLPRWSRDGRELFFVADGALHVVAMTGVNGGPSGVPRRLFGFEGSDYDVHPDGRLLVQRNKAPERHYLRVFRNWSMGPVADRDSGH